MSPVVVLAAVALFGPTARRQSAEPPPPACIKSWPEARYRPYGYDHVVHIASSCAADAVCAVATNVDPTPLRVVVPAGATREVTVRVGSPSREFTPVLGCQWEP